MDASPNSGSLQTRVELFCTRHQVEILYAFGSRAAEVRRALAEGLEIQAGQSSDIDIAVKLSGHRALSVREKAEMAVTLENLLGVERVDLVFLAEADPFLAVNIIRGERLFSASAYGADNYELYVLRRAGDLEHFERMRIDRIMGSSQMRPGPL